MHVVESADPAALHAAALKGDAPAMTRLAGLAANGILVQQDWRAALQFLGEAAALGEPNARAQLRVLTSSGAVDDWRTLAGTFDVQKVRYTPGRGALSGITGVDAVQSFLTPEACRHLIALGAPLIERQTVYQRAGGLATDDKERTNSGTFFSSQNTDVVVAMVRERIAAIFGISTHRLEPTGLLHYRVGEFFAEHYDALSGDFADARGEIERIGQRHLTLIVYLNDDFEGGETEFPVHKLKYRGKTGDALGWINAAPDRQVEQGSLHAGRAPTKGEKWVLSQWIRDRDCSRYWG